MLKKTIQSVLDQNYENYEIIVVDDCSIDDTEKIVKAFGDARIKYFKLDSNHGHDAYPKNYGIKQATGDYVAFLDDDDVYYKKEALKIMATYLLKTGADVAYGDYFNYDGKKRTIGWSLDFSPQLLAQRNYISMSVTFVKREKVIEVGGFNEELKQFKDWNLWVRLQKNGANFMHVPIVITKVLQHEDSISSKNKLQYDAQGNYISTFNSADCNIFSDRSCLAEKKPLKVAIFTLCLDRLEYTKRTYRAMRDTAGYSFDWFPVDQHSEDGTTEYLKSIAYGPDSIPNEPIFPYFAESNLGVAGGWDKGVEVVRDKGGYDIIIKVDNDALMITPNWLKDMVDLFEKNKGLILSPTVEGLEMTPGGVMRQRMDGQSPYVSINDHLLGIVPNIGGICFASYLDLYNSFKFPKDLPGNKDYFLCQVASRMGYSCFYMEEANVQHLDGSSGQKRKFPEYFKKTNG
jgi:glycosyltransferase involved in cell wall biosynthesis